MTFRSFVYKLQFKWRYFRLLYHHDNAPSHTSLKVMAKLDQLRFELVAHPPYSPDLAPSDYYLFPNFKRWPKERDSHRMRKSSRKPRRISKAWTFRTTERASKCWKIAISSVSSSKATMLRNKYNFAQKTLVFIKNPGTFNENKHFLIIVAEGQVWRIRWVSNQFES